MKKQFLELAALPKPSVNDIAVFDGRDWVARPLPTRSPTIIHKTTLERIGALGHPGGSGYALVSGDSSIDWDLTPLWEGTHTWSGTYEINLRDSALKVYSSVDGQLDIDADVEVELASAYFDIRADIRTDRWLNNDNNVFIGVGVIGSGNLAHTTGDTGYYNTSVGGYSGVAMTTGYDNTFFGFQAGYNVTSGYENTLVGESAGVTLDVGYRNTMVGCMCGQVQQTGYENVFVGYRTGEGRGAISAYQNVAIGVQAGSDLAAGSLNTFVGYQAGLLVQDAQYNVAVGASAGDALVSGGNNILIGFQAGNTLTTGAGNILIGHDVDTAANNTANFLSIGNLIFATGGFGTGTTIGAGNVGIKKNNPAEALDVTGSIGVSGTVDGIDVSAFGAIQFVTLAADAAVANERVLTGTANQVVITDGGAGNAVTLSLPQSIHTAATPTFGGLIIADGGTVGQAAGPLLTLDDTNNYLEVMGCNVGINVADPDTRLEVFHAGTQLKLSFDGTDNATFAVDTSGYLNIVPSGGLLGIGVTPTTTLHVYEAGNADVQVQGGTGTAELLLKAGAGTTFRLQSYSDQSFRISTSYGGYEFVITSINNVGINTSSPDRRLEVLEAGNLPQLRLTYTDSSVYTDFETNSSGYQVITPTGGTILTGAATDVRIGGGLYVGATDTDPVAGTLSVTGNEGYIRLLDSGDNNNARAQIGDFHTGGGYLRLWDDSEVDQATIRGYASANVQAYFKAGSVLVGTSTFNNAKLGVDQSSTTGAMAVLTLDQADVSEEFIRFIGTGAAGVLTQSIVKVADVASAPVAGYVRVYVQDDGNQLTDQAYYMAVVTLS